MTALEKTTVDVGIPTRGRAPYLAEAIESVLAQTFTGWRLLISENGSGSDAVSRAVEPYLDDPRITYRLIEEDVGAAGNHTAIVSTGEAPYVAILHDDDLWDPSFLQRHVEFLEAHPRSGLVFCRARHIDENGRELWRESYKAVTGGEHEPEDFARKMLHLDWVGVPSKVLVRRSAYEAVGPYHPEFLHWDYEMWTRIAARFPVGHIAGNYAAWRVHASQTTQLAPLRAEEAMQFFAHLVAVVEDALPPGTLSKRDRSRRRSGVHLSMALDALERGERRDALASLGRALRTYPPSAIDARAPIVAGLAPLGRAGGRIVRRARQISQRMRLRRGVSVHRT